ncbi:MAG: hypothetical protein ACF8QF_12980 [Phycisphaerales bacterium]
MRAPTLAAIAGAVACAPTANAGSLLPTDLDPALLGTTAQVAAPTAERGFWTTTFTSVALSYGFDTIGIRIYGGHSFAEPIFSAFTVPSWGTSYTNDPDHPTLAAADGPLTYIMTNNVTFDADLREAWVFDMLLFRDQRQLITTRFRYNGDFTFTVIARGISTDVTYCDFADCSLIPLPAGGALGAAGLGAIAARRRRR